jgi:hypothetical protein
MKIQKPEHGGGFFSSLGRIAAGKKEKEDEGRNRKRLDEAALVSRELGSQRITDGEIKKLIVSLVFEADRYIAAARESEGAYYDPLALDALDSARAAVNAWKKNENEAAAGKHFGIDPVSGSKIASAGIVVPQEGGPLGAPEGKGAGSEETRNAQIRAQTLGVLKESLRIFAEQNAIRAAGDMDAAVTDLAGTEGK